MLYADAFWPSAGQVVCGDRIGAALGREHWRVVEHFGNGACV